MSELSRLLLAATATLLLLASLAFVTWRQSRSFEVLAELEQARRNVAEARAEKVDLERGIEALESRAHVVPEARRRLGMHTPAAAELVILSGEPGL